ncbi:hypothetical protein CspeluHIS016_0503200 [Cutaneotrichosporon spelunceum]|uniref:Uncharacterized protein n=1 Tax=Cutaneotrichosporon spelunceum TaxID=1672016 RepID=A0AAD3TWN1_9TREE|nr:hypothetical protein CspeluHIS016_0503200 [Cutaneotrichosporon spelunceum]
MSLANHQPGTPLALRIPSAPVTLASRRPSTVSRPSTYGLDLSSLFIEPPALGKTKERTSNQPIENDEKIQPRILVGRDLGWVHFYGSSLIWSVQLLDHIEQMFPLQPIITLTPRCRIIQGWEGHIGAFDISNPLRLQGQSWLLPRTAQAWWREGYTDQLNRLFPREDIVFLLHRAEDVIASLKAADEELGTLKESLYWLMAEHTQSVCSSVANTHTSFMSASLASIHSLSSVGGRYTSSLLRSYFAKISALRTTYSAIHRLPALLVVIGALLQYLRVRARKDCAAIAARERKGTNTMSDGLVIQRLDEIACWHIAPELRLAELEELATEWFELCESRTGDLGRLADLIESRLRAD